MASAATQQHLRRLGAHGSSFNFSEGEEVALGALGSERVETAPAEIASSSHDAISVIRTGCRKRRVIKKIIENYSARLTLRRPIRLPLYQHECRRLIIHTHVSTIMIMVLYMSLFIPLFLSRSLSRIYKQTHSHTSWGGAARSKSAGSI